MKNHQILRELLLEKVKRALRVDRNKMILECRKLGLNENTLYDFVTYNRAYVQNRTAPKLYLAAKIVLGQ
jgi:hypothetical protein